MRYHRIVKLENAGVFSNNIGLKFYGDTVKAKRNTLEDVNKEIMRLLDKIDPMSYLG